MLPGGHAHLASGPLVGGGASIPDCRRFSIQDVRAQRSLSAAPPFLSN